MVKLLSKYSSWLVSQTELGPKSTKIIKISGLLEKRNRRNSNFFLVEGENAVEACANTGNLVEIFCTVDYLSKNIILDKLLKKVNIKINLVSDKALKKISDTESPAGIVGVSKSINKHLEKGDLVDKNFITVLFEISDPGNVGTILRSADAFGSDLVVIIGNSVDVTNGKIVRSSAGSIFNLEIRNTDLAKFMDLADFFKGNIYQTRADATKSLDKVALQAPVMWIFGNEAHGLKSFPKNLGLNVCIPMRGKTESLNVATAATLCMYETAKHRSIK